MLHTGTFEQNSFHSPIHPAPGTARISKEAKMHKKFISICMNLMHLPEGLEDIPFQKF